MTADSILDMADTIELLREALSVARSVDGTEIPDLDDRARDKGNSLVGAVNRDLSYLKHLCDRASVCADTLYWTNRGYADPLNGGS